jgi:hypothetical protein
MAELLPDGATWSALRPDRVVFFHPTAAGRRPEGSQGPFSPGRWALEKRTEQRNRIAGELPAESIAASASR